MFTIDDIEDGFQGYYATVPLITLETETRLDFAMRGLAAVYGFPTTKAFADSIISGTLRADRLAVYNAYEAMEDFPKAFDLDGIEV